MKMVTAQEIADKWGVSLRRVQDYCKQGKIDGVEHFGRNWMIPESASRPVDGRKKSSIEFSDEKLNSNMPMPKRTPFLYMTDLYNEPGCANEAIASLSGNPEAQTLLAVEIAYSRGQIDKVYNSAYTLLHKHSGFYAVISGGMLLALCAIWRGDLSLWRQAKIHIAEAPAKSDLDRDIMSFSITAVDSMLYDIESFPDWFKIGRFDVLPKDSLPAAMVFYAKQLYATGYAVATKQLAIQGVQGLSLMAFLPSAIEPMISQVMADKAVVAEIYLRMTCAAIYHNAGNDTQAAYHIDRAIVLAMPDKFYGLLAEYRRTLDSLLEQRVKLVDPDAWPQIEALYNIYNIGWSKLSGAVRGRSIITSLSPKQREVAKLAAFGMRNDEIAKNLHMSVSAVKQAITNVSNKTGMSRAEFAAIL